LLEVNTMRCRIHNLRRVYLASSAVAALVCLSAVCQADEPIRWKFTVGEKLDYNITQDMDMAMNMAAGGKLNSNAHQVMDMTWDVQGVNDQGEAVIEIKFDRIQMKVTGPMSADYDSSKDEPPTGMAATIAPLFKAMTKSPFEATMTSRGEIKDLKVPPDVLEALKNNPGAAQMGDLATPDGFQKIMQGAFTLPEKAPEKGEHWSSTVPINNPIGGKQTIETSYTYDGTKDVKGETFAIFRPEIKMTVEGTPQMKMNVKNQESAGELLFNEKAGRLDSMTLVRDVTLEVTVANQNLQQEIKQNIQVKLEPKGSEAGSETKSAGDEKAAK
jgi:hypothetical protein